MKITHSQLQMIIREELRAHFSSQELLREFSLDSFVDAVNRLPQTQAIKYTTPVGFLAALAADDDVAHEVVDFAGDWLSSNSDLLDVASGVLDASAFVAASTIVGAPASVFLAGASSVVEVGNAIGNFRNGEDTRAWFNLLAAAVPGVSARPAFELYKLAKGMTGSNTVILLKTAPDSFTRVINVLVKKGLELAEYVIENDEELSEWVAEESSKEEGETPLEQEAVLKSLMGTTAKISKTLQGLEKILEDPSLEELSA